MFYFIKTWKTVNYDNDTTRYTAGGTVSDVVNSLANCATILFEWFDDNFLKASSDKNHLLLRMDAPLVSNVNGGFKTKKLLGVTIDYSF